MSNSKDQGVGFSWFSLRSKELESIINEDHRLGFHPQHRNLDLEEYAKYYFKLINEYVYFDEKSLLIDIGAGGGQFSIFLEKLLSEKSTQYLMIDSEEVLQLGMKPKLAPIYGRFPDNFEKAKDVTELKESVSVFANSVLHYVKNDGLLEEFVSKALALVTPGGALVLSDIPTVNMKYAQAQANNQSRPSKGLNDFEWKDFAKLSEWSTSQNASLFIIPQPRSFPMHPHRCDLLVLKHKATTSWEK